MAAELAKRGFIASPTSRSSFGADLLVTDRKCVKTYSVQVKTNASTFNFWLVNKESKDLKSKSHIYVFVNLRDKKELTEYFIVPGVIVAKKMIIEVQKGTTWYSFPYNEAKKYHNSWDLFGDNL